MSGATALAYEVLWARDWALVYGSTAIGAAVVLAAYFAGLALGAALGGMPSRRRSPLALYAMLEAAVALSVLVYVAGRPLLAPAALWTARHVATPLLPAARALLAFAVLLVPTTLLGATLPVVLPALGAARPRVGTLYAANTLGGAAGALAVAFVGVRALGVRATFVVALAVDVLVAAAALHLARRAAPSEPAIGDAPAARVRRPGAALAVAGIGGFVGIAAEVLWMRGLAAVLSNSVYSVALVLAGVLVGIALGARLGGDATGPDTAERLGAVTAWLAISVAVSIVAVRALPALLSSGARVLGITGPLQGFALEAALALVVVLPSALTLGATLPLCVTLAGGDVRRAAGRVLAVNTTAGIVAALLAAFVLLPRLGVGRALATLALLAIVASVVARGVGRWTVVAVAAAVAAGVLPPAIVGSEHVLFLRDGATATVTVTADAQGQKRLRVNGQYSLGGAGGLFLERREAHLPLLLHPAPARLLALGVGTGDTIGAALAHPGLHIDGVEVVPEVLDAAALFAPENGGVLASPRAVLHVDDARTHLLATDDRYDVVLSDLFLPWTAGTATLYTAETYRRGLARLRPGGLYCQWLPLHQLAVGDLEAIVATFAGVFPEVQLWVAYHRATTPLAALIGSATPIRADADALRVRMAAPSLAPALRDVGLDDPADVAVLYVTDGPHLRVATAGVAAITDDHPRLEFTAPAAYFHQAGLARAALAWITARLDPAAAPVAGVDAAFQLRAMLLTAQLALLDGDGPRELAAYVEALRLAPDVPGVRAALRAIARQRRDAGDPATAARIEELVPAR